MSGKNERGNKRMNKEPQSNERLSSGWLGIVIGGIRLGQRDSSSVQNRFRLANGRLGRRRWIPLDCGASSPSLWTPFSPQSPLHPPQFLLHRCPQMHQVLPHAPNQPQTRHPPITGPMRGCYREAQRCRHRQLVCARWRPAGSRWMDVNAPPSALCALSRCELASNAPS